MEKNRPLNHTAKGNQRDLTKAMRRWTKAAPAGTTRSAILILSEERDGKLGATTHINGNTHHLKLATRASMAATSEDNPVGAVLRTAAIEAMVQTGALVPNQPSPEPTPETETHNNESNEQNDNN